MFDHKIQNPISFLHHYANLNQYKVNFDFETLTIKVHTYKMSFPQYIQELVQLVQHAQLVQLNNNNNEQEIDHKKKEIKRKCFELFLQSFPCIIEDIKQKDSIPIVDYTTWGKEHYGINETNIEYNNYKAYYHFLSKQPILFFDSEGSPSPSMIQLGCANSNKVYIYTDKNVIRHFYQFIFPSKNIKKILWGAKEEIIRARKYVEITNNSSIIDIQTKYNGISLKRAIGSIYNLRLEVINKKEFYSKNWSRPEQIQIEYAAIDIEAMKELYTN